MSDASRERVWNPIMAVQEQFNRLEEGFAAIPPEQIGWWLRWRFRKALDAMTEARGAHSHGEDTDVSESRLPWLEHAAKTYAMKLAKLSRSASEEA